MQPKEPHPPTPLSDLGEGGKIDPPQPHRGVYFSPPR